MNVEHRQCTTKKIWGLKAEDERLCTTRVRGRLIGIIIFFGKSQYFEKNRSSGGLQI